MVFTFAVERELVDANPVTGLGRGTEGKREEFLSSQELVSLLKHCRPELRLLFMVAATTGLRQGALRQLQWADLDLEAGTMLVKASYAKSSKPQLFPLVPQVVDGLRKLRDETKVLHIPGSDAVFRTKTGRPWSRSWLCHLVRREIDSCPGVPEEKRRHVSFHTLRHSFASLLMLDGVHPRKLQEALAHSDQSLTARYSHLDSEAMREIQRRMTHILDPDRANQIGEPTTEFRDTEGIPSGVSATAGSLVKTARLS